MYINAHMNIYTKNDNIYIKLYGDNIKARLFESNTSISDLQEFSKKVNDAKVCGPSSHVLNSMKEISLRLFDNDNKFLNELLYKKSGVIRLHIPEELRFFHWELISNGKTALCLRFQCSRIDDSLSVYKHIKKQKKAVIVSEQNPQLSKLGLQLRSKLRTQGWTTEFFANNSNINYSSQDSVDAFYYLGHEPEGNISFNDLLSISPTAANIVWIDTCRSADTENVKEIVNKFKCSHFIGNIDFVPELDETHESLKLTENFFINLTDGTEIAESLRLARVNSFESGNFDWTYPVLYGQPKTIIFPEALERKRKKILRKRVLYSLVLLLFTTTLFYIVSPYLPLPIHGKKIDKNKIAAFNSLGVKLWTFETQSEINDKILTGDVVGDYFPEIIFGTNCFDIENNKLLPETSKIYIISQQGDKLREISMKNENIYSSSLIDNMYEMHPDTLIDIDRDGKLDIIWRASHHDNEIELIAAESYCISKNDHFSLRYWCRGKILDFDIIETLPAKSTELVYIAELNNLGKRLITGNIELEAKLVQKAKNQSVLNRLFCLAPPWLGSNTIPEKTLEESENFNEKWIFLLPVLNDKTLSFHKSNDDILIKSKNAKDIFTIKPDLCLYKNSQKLNDSEQINTYWSSFKDLMNALKNDYIENAELSYNTIMENLPAKHYAGPPSFQYSVYLNKKGNNRRYKEIIQNGFEADSSVYNFYRILEFYANNHSYSVFWELFNSNYAKYNEPFFSQLAFFVAIDNKNIMLVEKFASALDKYELCPQYQAFLAMSKGNFDKASEILGKIETDDVSYQPNAKLLIECYTYLNEPERVQSVYNNLSEHNKNDLFLKAHLLYSQNKYNESLRCLTKWLEKNDYKSQSDLFIRISYPRVLWLMKEIAHKQGNETLEKQIDMKAEMIGGYGLIPPLK